MDQRVKCPLLNKEISDGYCFDLCNIASDDILIQDDKGKIKDWDKAQEVCRQCGIYEE